MMEDVHLYLKTKNGAEYFKQVDSHESIFLKPTLLCCSGFNCTHDSPETASGFTKRAEALLNTLHVSWLEKSFQLAAVTYSSSVIGDDSIREMNLGNPAYPAFENFVEQQLKPLFADKSGQKYPIDTVVRNFRNIQILAYSYGGVFVQQVGNILVDKMQQAGFGQAEIDQATKQILVVTAGSIAPIAKSKAKFSQIDIFHGKDMWVDKYTNNIAMLNSMAEDSHAHHKDYFAQNVAYDANYHCCVPDPNSSELVLLARASNLQDPECLRLDDAKNGNSGKAHERVPPENVKEDSFHGSPTYFNYSMTGAGMMLRTAMSVALNNGLNNSLKNYLKPHLFTPLPPTQELLISPARKAGDGSPKSIKAWRDSTGQEFNFDRKKDFTYVAHVIDYDNRMSIALGTQEQQQRN